MILLQEPGLVTHLGKSWIEGQGQGSTDPLTLGGEASGGSQDEKATEASNSRSGYETQGGVVRGLASVQPVHVQVCGFAGYAGYAGTRGC